MRAFLFKKLASLHNVLFRETANTAVISRLLMGAVSWNSYYVNCNRRPKGIIRSEGRQAGPPMLKTSIRLYMLSRTA